MTGTEIEEIRERYIEALKPLFYPDLPFRYDSIAYFSSLLRVLGIEDKGWDPYLESRATLEDLNAIFKTDLAGSIFPDKDAAIWRLGLVFYSHIVEMSAPYEVLTNLLRFRLGKGYSPNPYYDFLDNKGKKRFEKSKSIYPRQKIEIIKKLSQETGLCVGGVLEDFYNKDLRNAISHSDYILTDKEFRSRNGISGFRPFIMSLDDLNETITKAKLFISTFFSLEKAARRLWAQRKQESIPYDPTYKGLMEVLVKDDLMCGYKIHWPNNSESYYIRTPEGIDMVNCMLSPRSPGIELRVGLYAREPGSFSPLVEKGDSPKYTPIDSTGALPEWKG